MMLTAEAIAILLQPAEKAEIFKRAHATAAAMERIEPEWSWDEETPVQFRHRLGITERGDDSFDGQRLTAWTIQEKVESELLGALDEVHRATVKGVGVARIAWADMPERAILTAALSASGKVADEILREAEEWESAWRLTDPAYIPIAGFTLAGLQAQIATVQAGRQAVREATIHARQADARLAVALAELNDLAQAWYAMATTIWDAETPEGRTLRGTIPTTYRPRYAVAAKRRRAAKRAAAAGETPG